VPAGLIGWLSTGSAGSSLPCKAAVENGSKPSRRATCRCYFGGVQHEPIRIQRSPAARLEQIVCPECELAYKVEAASLGRDGRRVRCPKCKSVWFAPAASGPNGGANPILSPDFCRKLTRYLNGLPARVKQDSKKSTHAIKTFLMREGVSDGAIGYANGIRVDLPNFRNAEFLWDAAVKVPSPTHPGEDCDLTFVAESENVILIDKIIEDANKLPIVRADARMMFFRANDPAQREYFFERLRGLFERHRRTERGDVYIIAGMEKQKSSYLVRKLTILREGSNESPWQEF
jgi:predicted Zn finger-like uncharacterized protein